MVDVGYLITSKGIIHIMVASEVTSLSTMSVPASWHAATAISNPVSLFLIGLQPIFILH